MRDRSKTRGFDRHQRDIRFLNSPPTRNIDLTIQSLRFDCCVFLFYSLSAVTFATQSEVKQTWRDRRCWSVFDPNVWSGRAVQEVSSTLADAVLHQCIRLLIGAYCAPSHHGYQRACGLISGQASNGPFGSPVFACAGKTDPPLSSHPLADLGG